MFTAAHAAVTGTWVIPDDPFSPDQALETRAICDAYMRTLGLTWKSPRLLAFFERVGEKTNEQITLQTLPHKAMLSLVKLLRDELQNQSHPNPPQPEQP